MTAALAVYALLGGAVSLAGWVLDLPRLADWESDGIAIQPNTSLAAACAGAALLLLLCGLWRSAAVLGTFVAVIGGTALFQMLSGVSLGIDDLLLFGRTWGRVGVIFPGRMGPPAAVSWTLIGAALLLLAPPGGERRRAAVPVLGMLAAGVASLSLLGYMYGASALYARPTLTVIALQTATFILAVALGLLASVGEHGPMRLIGEDGPAGVLIRRTVPALIVVPIVLGLFRVLGERAGMYDSTFGTAIHAVLEIVCLLVLLGWTAKSISRQVEQRLQAERRVAASEQRLRTTLESITDGLVTLDQDGCFDYVNAEAERLLRKTRDELIGQSIWEMFPAAMERSQPQLQRAAVERVTVEFEAFNPTLDRWFANKAYPTADGGLAIYFRDVTVRKHAEDAVRTSQEGMEAELASSRLLQAMSVEFIWEDDIQALYQKIVDAAVPLMRAQFASMQMLESDHGTDSLKLLAFHGFNARAAEFWQRVRLDSPTSCGAALRSGQRVQVPDVETCASLEGTEDLAVFRDTGIRAVQTTPLLSRTGKTLGMISTHWSEPHEPADRELRLLDILARQAADLIDRRRNEEALREADRRKDIFLATLAHELRNPLAPMRNAVELIKLKGTPDAELVWARDVIDRQVTVMARLLDDLLDIGRISGDKLELRRQQVELGSVIRRAVDACRPQVDSLKHTLIVALPPQPIELDADPVRLGQIFGNLFDNACKYTPAGGHIWVSAGQEGPQAVVRVRDAGIGIPQANLSSIFDMFAQVDRRVEGAQRGLGIGLHLVKRLVELHGGTVEAESAGEGRGSEFTVRLPLVAVSSLVAGTPAGRPRRPPAPPRRILVVDDNRDSAESLAMLLMHGGHDAQIAYDGIEAVEKANSYKPDLILLDIGLPKLNGYDACREIRRRPTGRKPVVVALSGWGQEQDRRRSTQAGFDAHWVKPVDRTKLMDLLASLSDR